MQELEFIKAFLKQNCGYVLEKFHDKQLVTVTNKGSDPNDLLTEVDLTVQKRFVDAVREAFPDDIVVGEESGLDNLPPDPNGRVWVIDPVDGTYNFMRGLNPGFAISIAFADGGTAQAAGVALPLNNALVVARAGEGAFLNDRRLAVSQVQRIEESCIEIDFSSTEDRRAFVRRAVEVMRHAGQVRCQGSAVLGICQVATGDVDGYLHMTLAPWDYAAAQLIAEEAGAIATRLNGVPLRIFDGKQGVLVTNGAIHKSVLSMITP